MSHQIWWCKTLFADVLMDLAEMSSIMMRFSCRVPNRYYVLRIPSFHDYWAASRHCISSFPSTIRFMPMVVSRVRNTHHQTASSALIAYLTPKSISQQGQEHLKFSGSSGSFTMLWGPAYLIVCMSMYMCRNTRTFKIFSPPKWARSRV